MFADPYLDFRERVLDKAVGEYNRSMAVKEKLPSIRLFYTKPSENSDKEYFVEIVKAPDGYDVLYAYGKRGHLKVNGVAVEAKKVSKKNKKNNKKTTTPVSLTEAKRVFDDVVWSKKKEGYTTNPSGVPFSK